MARCLDENGEDASLLDKKLKELMAESISRKQKEGRKKSNTGGSWKQRRFVELHEQIERLVAELPPAKERTEEQKAELQRMVKEKCKMMMQRTGRGLAEEDQHLAPERNERERRRRKEEQEQEADAVAKEAEQEQEQVEVHPKKSECKEGRKVRLSINKLHFFITCCFSVPCATSIQRRELHYRSMYALVSRKNLWIVPIQAAKR